MDFTQRGFVDNFKAIQHRAYLNAFAKGWWDEPREDGTLIALMHSELSEALEYLRHNNPTSDHIADFSGVEEEMADVIIRIMDLSDRRGWKVAEAIIAKMDFNAGREFKHGGKEF